MVKSTKSFVLRLDAATMQAVEKWAADEFRSTNGQLQWIIADALRRNRRQPRHTANNNGQGDSHGPADNNSQDNVPVDSGSQDNTPEPSIKNNSKEQ